MSEEDCKSAEREYVAACEEMKRLDLRSRALAMKRDEEQKAAIEANTRNVRLTPEEWTKARGHVGVLHMQSPSDDAMLAVLVKRCAELRAVFERMAIEPAGVRPFETGVRAGLEFAVAVMEGSPRPARASRAELAEQMTQSDAAMLQRDAAANKASQPADFATELAALVRRHSSADAQAVIAGLTGEVRAVFDRMLADLCGGSGSGSDRLAKPLPAGATIHSSDRATSLAEPATQTRADRIRPPGWIDDPAC